MARRVFLAFVLVAAALTTAAAGGRKAESPPYLDPSAPVVARVADLLARMTLAEKAGQLAMIHVGRLRSDADLADVLDRSHVGAILSGAGETPSQDASVLGWTRGVNALQRYALSHSRLGIPIVYGSDATHGFTWLRGAEVFPQQLGLAATRNPKLVEQIAAATTRVTRQSGVRWVFGPVADVARDLRWGRYYETYGENPATASAFVAAAVTGFQGADPNRPDVAATAKHFLGYSQPASGLDAGRVQLSQSELGTVFTPPFRAAVDAHVATVMNQHGWLNGEPTVASRAILTDLLRRQLGFTGVTLSDWGDVENLFCSCQGAPAIQRQPHVVATYERAVAMALNAGLDVSMVPERASDFVAAVQAAARDGLVSEATIDAAVGRVLALKFRLGLFEQPYVDEVARPARTPADVALSRAAATASITVLRNRARLLPLSRRGPVLIVGPSADNLARQDGGWTVAWQGVPDGVPAPPGHTVVAGVRRAVGSRNVLTVGNWNDARAVRAAARRARFVIAAVGEDPYAEWEGDTRAAALAADEQRLVRTLEGSGRPVVLVLIAGRPLMIADLIRHSAAFVMAYLPGSEGGDAIADILFGRASARGRLPFTWPATIRDVPMALNRRLDGKSATPLFRYGAGLKTSRS
jgi:beta-glucosidase